MPDKIEFSPAIAVPVPFDVKKRIQELRDCLDPKHPHYECEQQHVNIRAAIQLYEDGKIDGSEEVFIMDGKVVTEEEMYKGTTWTWVEVHSFKSLPRTHLTNGFKLQETCYEFAEKHAYSHGTFGRCFHEVRNQAVFSAPHLNFAYFRFACELD
jgi:hypothetical protein